MANLDRTFTMTIDGKAAPVAATFEVVNPSTGEVIAEAPDCTREELDLAMETAHHAFTEWHDAGDSYRKKVMHEVAGAIEENAEDLGRIQTMEQGRPIRSSVDGVRKRAERFHHYADLEIPRLVVQDDDEARVEIVRRPLGVIAAIKPWNGPATNVLNAVAPAIRAGNSVVFKPSPFTPLSALAIGEILREIVPPGVVNVISGRDPLGQWVAEHPIPRGISFTGSSATGRKVNASAAPDLKRVLLELGGNDAAIVLDDVDPENVAERIFWGAFSNSGQVCMAIKRVYIHESVFEVVSGAIAKVASGVTVGDPLAEQTQLGPLTNRVQFDRVRDLVDDALAHGAVALAGGKPIEGPGCFFEPTILANVTDEMRIVAEEQFGPVLPLMSYKTIDEAIARANGTPFGLGGSVWSSDPQRAAEISERLETGTAWVNTHFQTSDRAPFGGRKGSGIGQQNGLFSIYAYTDPQVLWQSRRSNPDRWVSRSSMSQDPVVHDRLNI